MLRKEDFEHIGTLGRAHGTQGEVSAKLSVDLSGLWEGADTSLFLMLEEQGLLIPYRVLKRRTKGEDIDLITFSGITTKDVPFGWIVTTSLVRKMSRTSSTFSTLSALTSTMPLHKAV